MAEEGNEKLRKVTWPQWIAGTGVLFLTIQVGMMSAWSSPYIEYLTSSESPFLITMSEISWVVSLLNIGRPFGAIGCAVCINYLGTKTAVLLTCVPLACSWLFIGLANNVDWLYVGRFFGGLGVGMAYSCYSLYLGEIADSSNRGALIALGTMGVPTGNLIMSATGAYLSMKMSAFNAFVFCLILIIIFLWLPESPHHFIKKNLYDRAKASIRWYHRDFDVELEFIGLKKFIESISKQTSFQTLKELKYTHFRKTILIVTILIGYHQMSGTSSILFYMESILTSSKISVLPASIVVIIVMSFGILGSLLSIFLMDRFGRKALMIASCIGIILSLSLVTAEFQLLSFDFDPREVQALSIIGMCGFYMTLFTGVIPVPPAILGEIFPPQLKSIAACFTSLVAGIASFVSAATYQPLLQLLTERYLFIFYGVFVATAIPFTIFCVPETKGLSLQEIQNQLMGKKEKRETVCSRANDEQRNGEQNSETTVKSS